jgi:xylulokinase
LLVGIDVGTTRTKAMLVDAGTGDEVRTVAVDSPFVTSGARTEAAADALLDAVRRVLADLGGDDLGRVVGVGVAGVAECGAPFDAGGRALAPVIAWHDRRGESVVDRLSAKFGSDLDRAIGQQLRYILTVAKLGWLVEDGLASPPTRWLGVPELVLRALTGAEATEWSLAARTGCFDVGRQEWMPEVARAAGFDVEVFPPIMGAGEVMGRITQEAAAWSGLPAGVPVTVVGHDHLVGFVGSGAGPDDLVNSVGTAETVVGRSPSLPDLDRALHGGIAVSLFPGGDGWAVLSSAARAGQVVDAAAAALGHPPAELDRLLAGLGGPADVELLDAPGLLESLRDRRPPALPDGDPARVWATLLDVLAIETAAAVDRVTGLLGPRRRLVVFGGGSASAPALAAKSRRVSLPVERAPVEGAVARGAALLGGVAAGRLLR